MKNSIGTWLAPRLLILLMILAGSPLLAQMGGDIDLSEVYSGALDHDAGAGPVDWEVSAADVWRLQSFSFRQRGSLELSFGEAHAVIGRHVSPETGTSAVWAAVFPDKPRAITSSEPGHGDKAWAVFLRFHPSLVGELFPAGTIQRQGDPSWLVWGKRQFAHKINGAYQSGNMPVIPDADHLVFDIDTLGGKRRFYSIDRKAGKIQYVGAFESRGVPEVPPDGLEEEEAAAILKAAWAAFDAEYAMFGVKPEVDWKAAFHRYEPLAKRAKSSYELAGVIALMLSELKDLHIFVRQGETDLPGYNRVRPGNGNWPFLRRKLRGVQNHKGLSFGKLEGEHGVTFGDQGFLFEGDIGYIALWNLTTSGLSDTLDEALEEMKDTRGLILDLRFNGGGDEILARRIAGRFATQGHVYSQSRYRNGPKHDDLGEAIPRRFEPRGPWAYTAPVIVLQGQRTMSSAESLVLMLGQCDQVQTMGDRTAGSSANPRRLELDRDIVINLPRWLDLDPAGKPIDRVGIAPDIDDIAKRPVDFRTRDPLFRRAFQKLNN